MIQNQKNSIKQDLASINFLDLPKIYRALNILLSLSPSVVLVDKGEDSKKVRNQTILGVLYQIKNCVFPKEEIEKELTLKEKALKAAFNTLIFSLRDYLEDRANKTIQELLKRKITISNPASYAILINSIKEIEMVVENKIEEENLTVETFLEKYGNEFEPIFHIENE